MKKDNRAHSKYYISALSSKWTRHLNVKKVEHTSTRRKHGCILLLLGSREALLTVNKNLKQ